MTHNNSKLSQKWNHHNRIREYGRVVSCGKDVHNTGNECRRQRNTHLVVMGFGVLMGLILVAATCASSHTDKYVDHLDVRMRSVGATTKLLAHSMAMKKGTNANRLPWRQLTGRKFGRKVNVRLGGGGQRPQKCWAAEAGTESSDDNNISHETGQPDKNEDPEHRLSLYAITGAHGLKGEVKARMLTDSFLDEWDQAWLAHPRLSPRPIQVQNERETVKGGQSESIIKIAGIDSIDEAKAIVGGSIFVDADEDFGEPVEDIDDSEEVPWPEMWDHIEDASEVIGFSALQASTEQVVGEVESIIDNGIQDILVLKYYDKEGTFMVPFVEPLVPIVDVDERMIVLADIQGLF